MLNFDLDTLRASIECLDLIYLFYEHVGDAEICLSTLKANFDVSSYMEALIEELFCSTIVDVRKEWIDKGVDIYNILRRNNEEATEMFFEDFLAIYARNVLDLEEYFDSEEYDKDFEEYFSSICMYKLTFKTKLIPNIKDDVFREFFIYIPALVKNIFSLWGSDFVGIEFNDMTRQISLYCIDEGNTSFDYDIDVDMLLKDFKSLIINFKDTKYQ